LGNSFSLCLLNFSPQTEALEKAGKIPGLLTFLLRYQRQPWSAADRRNDLKYISLSVTFMKNRLLAV
jgi:hypothetical protein